MATEQKVLTVKEMVLSRQLAQAKKQVITIRQQFAQFIKVTQRVYHALEMRDQSPTSLLTLSPILGEAISTATAFLTQPQQPQGVEEGNGQSD